MDEYLAATPPAVRRKLERLRAIVRAEAPEATEKIAYGMSGFHLGGPLVYFAAFPGHIGFYALPSGTAAFRASSPPYRSGKGSVQFPLPGDPPWDLVREHGAVPGGGERRQVRPEAPAGRNVEEEGGEGAAGAKKAPARRVSR